MQTLKFFDNYLLDQALVVLKEGNEILYKGSAGGVHYWLLVYSNIKDIYLDDSKYLIIDIKRSKELLTDVEEEF